MNLQPKQIWRDSDPNSHWDMLIVDVEKNYYTYQFVPRTGIPKGFSSDLHVGPITNAPSELTHELVLYKEVEDKTEDPLYKLAEKMHKDLVVPDGNPELITVKRIYKHLLTYEAEERKND